MGVSNRFSAGLIVLAIAFVTYSLAAQLGLQLIDPARKIALFWPAAGIAVGLMASVHARHVPLVAAAIFTSAVFANLAFGKSISSTLILAAANSLEALTAAYLLHRGHWNGRFHLSDLASLRDLLLSALAAVAVGATISTIGLQLVGETNSPFLSFWLVWVLGNGVGILALAPLVVVATDRYY